jgi:hypothetical protein
MSCRELRRIPDMPATKLTDTQLVVLSTASQREDHGVMLPSNLKGGAAHRLVSKLIDTGLVEEIRARAELPVWRRDEDNRPMALRITKRGLKAIQVEDDPQPVKEQASDGGQPLSDDGAAVNANTSRSNGDRRRKATLCLLKTPKDQERLEIFAPPPYRRA